MRSSWPSAFAAAGVAALTCGVARAADLEVGAGQPYATVEEALAAAASGDRVLVHGGVHEARLSWSSGALTIEGVGPVDEVVIVAVGGPALSVGGQAELTVAALTLDGAGAHGAVVATGASSLALHGVVVRDTLGTGVVVGGSATATLVGSALVDGTTDGDGGLLRVESSATVSDTLFAGGAAARGGAIASNGSITVDRSWFCANTADEGGAIRLTDGEIVRSVLQDNVAEAGGGLAVAGDVRLDRLDLIGNTAPDGAALRVEAGSATITNTLVAWNRGGGAAIVGGDLVSSQWSLWWDNDGEHSDGAAGIGVLRHRDPGLAWVAGVCDPEALVPAEGSPLIDAGDPFERDADGTRADIGAFVGPSSGGLPGCDGWYADRDGDGYGDPDASYAGCGPFGRADRAGDCDDTDPAVHPGAPERDDDGTDQDCDGHDASTVLVGGCDHAAGHPWSGAALLGLLAVARRRSLALLLLSGAARAQGLDAGGAPPLPAADVRAPTSSWTRESLADGIVVSLHGAWASAPLVRLRREGPVVEEVSLLRDLHGTSLGVGARLHERVGVALTAPWWAGSRGEVRGAAFGDLGLQAPIVVADGAGWVLLVPGVTLPTGSPASHLGAGRVVPGARLAVGRRLGAVSGGVDVGGEPRALDLRGHVSVAGPVLGIHGEVRARTPPAVDGVGRAWPAEALVSARARAGGLGFTAGVGHALSSGVGASPWRAWAGVAVEVGRSSREAPLPPVGERAIGPTVPVSVRVVDADGRPSGATIALLGPTAPGPPRTDAVGTRTWDLGPGAWTLRIEDGGRVVQERTFVLDGARSEPVRMDAILLPASSDGHLVVRAVDPDGRPVEDALVLVDGAAAGTMGPGGALDLRGVARGEHVVEVRSERLDHTARARVTVDDHGAEARVTLDWPPGSVRIRARGPDGRVTDALAALRGPTSLPPAPLGPDGERIFQLRPGPWTVLISSAAHGAVERAFTVSGPDLVEVEVALEPVEVERTDVIVALRDPDGAPIAGAEVLLGGRPVALTDDEGEAAVRGAVSGLRELALRHPALEAWREVVDLPAGRAPVHVTARWRPGALSVVATDRRDQPVDALVAFSGPGTQPPIALGDDGAAIVVLPPGSWEAIVSSPAHGAHTRRVALRDDGRLAPMSVGLLPATDGGSALALEVLGGDGEPVVAEVALAGDELGRTGADGRLTVEALPRGRWALEVRAVGHAPWAERIRLAGPSQHRVRLAWAPGALVVAVRDPADRPVRDALIAVRGPGSSAPVGLDDDGRAVLGLAPGSWDLLVSSPSLGTVEREVALPDAPTVTALTVRMERPGVVGSLSGRVRFALDSAALSADAAPVLDAVAAWMEAHPSVGQLEIQGHTDDSGTVVYNLDLSRRRAEAVLTGLVARGVPRERLRVRGYGMLRPLTLEPADRYRNRRVEFVPQA